MHCYPSKCETFFKERKKLFFFWGKVKEYKLENKPRKQKRSGEVKILCEMKLTVNKTRRKRKGSSKKVHESTRKITFWVFLSNLFDNREDRKCVTFFLFFFFMFEKRSFPFYLTLSVPFAFFSIFEFLECRNGSKELLCFRRFAYKKRIWIDKELVMIVRTKVYFVRFCTKKKFLLSKFL
jgi:hypothetical protein